MTESSMAFISMPGGPEWIVIGIIGLLIFGKRLPEVARSLGKTVVEFKKGLSSVEHEIQDATRQSTTDTNPYSSPGSTESNPYASSASTEPNPYSQPYTEAHSYTQPSEAVADAQESPQAHSNG